LAALRPSFFFRTALAARRLRDAEALAEPARLVSARLRCFVLDFVLFWARRVTFRRGRFAMAKIPFKSLTGFG